MSFPDPDIPLNLLETANDVFEKSGHLGVEKGQN